MVPEHGPLGRFQVGGEEEVGGFVGRVEVTGSSGAGASSSVAVWSGRGSATAVRTVGRDSLADQVRHRVPLPVVERSFDDRRSVPLRLPLGGWVHDRAMASTWAGQDVEALGRLSDGGSMTRRLGALPSQRHLGDIVIIWLIF